MKCPSGFGSCNGGVFNGQPFACAKCKQLAPQQTYCRDCRVMHLPGAACPTPEEAGAIGARKSFYRQLPFLQFIEAHGLPRSISAALELMGTRVGPLRAPLQPLDREKVDELRRILVDLEVLPRA